MNGMKFATTPCISQGGALKIIHIINNALIFRPLLSSCCSLCLPQAAVTNEPVLKEIIYLSFQQRFRFGSAVFSLHDELFSKLRLPKCSCYQGRFLQLYLYYGMIVTENIISDEFKKIEKLYEKC
ncbi:MAG: hypothetical protein ACLTSM_10075 [Eubacterium sp.]